MNLDNINIPSDGNTDDNQRESELGTNARSIESTPNGTQSQNQHKCFLPQVGCQGEMIADLNI
jgi:hypothetical protein